ncbi:glycosyltransferase family 9 protein [Rhodocista pekingensis]|uniref:Glycosyltransferase family 9 protein n=1 Tax=Rhodocista pekingensis TaxID=201185 RepID=A0ABW2KU26_9PROT
MSPPAAAATETAAGAAAGAGDTARRVLVIRLGALGDLIQCFDAFHAVRARHPGAEVALLTKPAFAGFGRTMPWFDRVWEDGRSRSPAHYWHIRALLRGARLDVVYDLQAKPRTRLYRRLLWPGPAPRWPVADPAALAGRHNRDRYLAVLAAGGVADAGAADLSWLAAPVDGVAPAGPFVLLVPGCSPHLPHKRWPPAHYAALGRSLLEAGTVPVLVGTAADRDAADRILADCPGALDLVGRTSLAQLGSLARRAAATVGNDTGPVFLTAAAGCPTLMLMSHHTDPVRSAPWGPRTAWLKRDDLSALPVAEVAAALAGLAGV